MAHGLGTGVNSIVSKIWYVFDFGGPAGVMDFVGKHAAAEVAKDLDGYRVAGPTGTIPWDWALNQRP